MSVPTKIVLHCSLLSLENKFVFEQILKDFFYIKHAFQPLLVPWPWSPMNY